MKYIQLAMFKASLRRIHYARAPSYLGDALDKVKPVDLVYDLHEPPTKQSDNPIIILHGIFGSKSNNRTVGKTLAQTLKRDVIVPDLRNFGNSPHVDRLDYPSLAADVEHLIESKGLNKPIIIGHSMGAKAAMAVALRRPELLKMLISVDNAPMQLATSDSSFTKYINAFKKSIEVDKVTDIKEVDQELAKVEPNKYVRQFLLTNLNRGKKSDPITSKIPLDIVNDALLSGLIASWPYDPNVSRWTRGPALFIRGTDSNYVADEYIPDIGKFFPNFEIRDIKAGHWVISENPNEFVKVVTEFVNRNEDD